VNYLLDTVALSEPVRGKPNRAVLNRLKQLPMENLYISVLALGEIRKGLIQMAPSKRKTSLTTWLLEVQRDFSDRTLPISLEVANRWGVLQGECSRRGRPLPVIDSLLAATALVHDLTVVTRNVSHFEESKVRVLDPWADQ
jgi:toxin FitB